MAESREAIHVPRAIPADAEMRLARLRRVAWILDRAFSLGGKARFGVDPLLGLVPVAGDWIVAVLSLYVVYESLRLGLPWPVLGRMLANVGIEAVVGTVPVVGDVFDFIWQANTRNLRLVERHYHPSLCPRSNAAIYGFLLVLALLVVALTVAAVSLAVWMLKLLVGFFS